MRSLCIALTITHVALIFACGIPQVASAQDEVQTVDRSEVQAALNRWTDTIHNFEIHWKWHSDQDVLPTLGPDATREELDGWYRVERVWWDASGKRRSESEAYRRGELLSHSITASIADEYLRFRADVPQRIPIDPTTGCAVVTHSNYRVLLAPRHGYFIRQRKRHLPQGTYTYNIDEYQEVLPEIWAPIKGHYTRPDGVVTNRTDWEVTKLVVNQEFPPELFFPPQPDEDTIVEDNLKGRTYRHDQSQWDRICEIVDELNDSDSRRQVSAFRHRPAEWWRFRFGLLAAEFAILMLVLILGFSGGYASTPKVEDKS